MLKLCFYLLLYLAHTPCPMSLVFDSVSACSYNTDFGPPVFSAVESILSLHEFKCDEVCRGLLMQQQRPLPKDQLYPNANTCDLSTSVLLSVYNLHTYRFGPIVFLFIAVRVPSSLYATFMCLSSYFFHANPKLIIDMSLLYATVLLYWKRWFCNILVSWCSWWLIPLRCWRYFIFCNVI
jgi:hypothetical protein